MASGTPGGVPPWLVPWLLGLLCDQVATRIRPYRLWIRSLFSDELEIALPNIPPVHGPAVEELRRGHHAVALEHDAVLHNEADVAEGVDVL